MPAVQTIYLDHQATTPIHSDVLDAMRPWLTEAFGNPHSSDHVLGWRSSQAVDTAAEQVARLIGADADEIIFTSGATESNNMALLGLARRAAGGPRRRVLLSAIEHKSVLAAGRAIKEQLGFSVEHIPVDREGFIDMDALFDALDEEVLAVSVMAVNNEIGTIQHVARISEMARAYGAMFHCDAGQASLSMPMDDFAEIADMVSLSAHKMYGPKGIGALYVSRTVQPHVEPLIYGGGQQHGLRSGTTPAPLCVGMGVAADKLGAADMAEKRSEMARRRDAFVERLRRLPWPIALNGPSGSARHPGNANIRFDGFSAHDLLAALQPNLAASTGSACTSGTPEPSHVLKALGLSGDEAESSVRFSLGFATSDRDVESAVALIEAALQKLSAVDLISASLV